MSNVYDITVERAKSYYLQVAALDPNGTPLNLVGYDVTGVARLKYSDTGMLLNLGACIDDPTNGLISFYLSSSDTEALPITEALYSIDISSGTFVQNILAGHFLINPSVY